MKQFEELSLLVSMKGCIVDTIGENEDNFRIQANR